jgi:phytoene dehydrogenase-like protein
MSTPISRSAFLKAMAGCGVLAVSGKLLFDSQHPTRQIPCRMLGPSRALGHKLRDRKLPMPEKEVQGREVQGKEIQDKNIQGKEIQEEDIPSRNVAVCIVGGGMAGLSAGWWLKNHGLNDFTLLELEPNVGGNSASGKNQFSAYPWGAHYVPVANDESEYVRALFKEFGIIKGFDGNGAPIYDELFLCHDPQERLLKDGSFQEGLVPKRGLQKNEQHEMARFFALMHDFKTSTGSDGKPAFAIPLDLSSQDPKFTALDKISMHDWLKKNDFHTRPLLWYVNYCCRDDYGSVLKNVSAWAGVHYFAGRRGTAANAEPNSVVTWPEGNGFIVNKLRAYLEGHIETNAAVTKIVQKDGHVITTFWQPETNKYASIRSECVVFAAPRFISKYIIAGADRREQTQHAETHQSLSYAPWMVANVSLKQLPEARGLAAAWDNVSYYSDSLGYVVATHQEINTRKLPTVITYYYPLSDAEPVDARSKLLSQTADQWCKTIVDDLEKMHSGIADEIISIDCWPWGHGMIRPSVGYIWSDARKKMKENEGQIYFAHSDMSGMSNFEEAQYHGVEAAKKVLARLGVG